MARHGKPQEVLPHIRRAQALLDGTVDAAQLPENVLKEARKALGSGPLAKEHAKARQEWEEKSAAYLQRQAEEQEASIAVRRARYSAEEITRKVTARVETSPWPEVKDLQAEATVLRQVKHTNEEHLQELSKKSSALMKQMNGFGFLRSWATTDMLKALIVREKPPALATRVAGWLGVDTVPREAAEAYFQAERLNVEGFNLQLKLEAVEKSIEGEIRAHPETTAARAEVSNASMVEVRARMLREEAHEQERSAYRRLSETMKAQWKAPEFVELASAAARLPAPAVKDIDRRIQQHYTSVSSSPSSSDPTFALTQGLLWWSMLSSTTSAQASPVFQDTTFLNNVAAEMVFNDVTSPGYTSGSAFSTGGGLDSTGYSDSPSYSPSPSYDSSPSPSPSYDSSSSSSSYDSGSSSSSYSSGGDF